MKIFYGTNAHGAGVVQAMGAAHRIDYERHVKEPYSRERIEEDVNVCLNCTRERCETGRCKLILESRRKLASERKKGK